MMKKITAIIITLSVLLGVLCAFILPNNIITPREMSGNMTFDSDGNVYIATNGERYSRIIGADKEGNVNYCYQDENSLNGLKTMIGVLATTQDKLYFIRHISGEQRVSFDSWELVRVDIKTGQEDVLYKEQASQSRVTGLSVSDEFVYLTSVNESSRLGTKTHIVELYRIRLEEDNAQLLLVNSANAPEGIYVRTAVHGGGSTICALLSDGTLVRVNNGMMQQMSVPDAVMPISRLYAVNGYLFARSSQQGVFLTGTVSRLHERECTDDMQFGVATVSDIALCMYTNDKSMSIAFSEGTDAEVIKQFKLPLNIRLELRLQVMIITAVVIAIIWVVVWLIYKVAKSHKLRKHMMLSVVGTFAVFFIVLTLAAIYIFNSKFADENERLASWYANQVSDAFSWQDGIVSIDEGRLMEMFDAQSDNSGSGISYVLYTVSKDNTLLPASLSKQELSAKNAIITSAQKAFEQGYASSAQTLIDGRKANVSAVPIRQDGDITGVLVLAVTNVQSSLLAGNSVLFIIICSVMLFVVCSVIISLYIRCKLYAVEKIAEQMDKISIGDTNLDDIQLSDDEIGRMYQSLKELSIGMSIKDYETKMTLEACRRFVPNGLEKLLNRASITEVCCGDLTASEGTIGLITVNNSSDMRFKLDDNAFMKYINDCFLTIRKNIRPQGGILLTSGFDLNAVRVLFTKEPEKGVYALINLIGDKNASDDNLDCFTFLHKSKFLYGVAGAEDESFPYLASAEISFFREKMTLLAETGCKLVVTEAFLKSLNEKFSTRYIGFFADDSGKKIYKLYEVLNSYGELERTKREQYDVRMQEAINCFYRNDFYLARNLFLAILRLCPEDGIARWYLFASEHYFNAAAGEEARYDLFGIKH